MTYDEAFSIIAKVDAAGAAFSAANAGQPDIFVRFIAAFNAPDNAEVAAQYREAREFLKTYSLATANASKIAADSVSVKGHIETADTELKAVRAARAAKR